MFRLGMAFSLLLSLSAFVRGDEAPANTLTAKEIAQGWILLFDGETNFGWKIDGEAKVENGVLVLGGSKAANASLGFALDHFELRLAFGTEGASPAELIVDTRAPATGNMHTIVSGKAWSSFEMTMEPEAGVSPSTISAHLEGKGGSDAKGHFKGSFTHGPGPVAVSFGVPAGSKLSLRGVKLRPLGLQSIFNGKDLSGWKVIPGHKSIFSVNDHGELNVKNGNGDLQSEGQWDDFALQLECISHGEHLNSGVFFRCLPGQFWSGYEAQIRNQWQGNDRSKPVDYGTGGIYNRQPARRVVSSDHEWFTMTVIAQGNHLGVWVNGYQTADYLDTRPPNESARKGSKVDRGPISLQGHDPTTNLSFRHIRIAALPKAAN